MTLFAAYSEHLMLVDLGALVQTDCSRPGERLP